MDGPTNAPFVRVAINSTLVVRNLLLPLFLQEKKEKEADGEKAAPGGKAGGGSQTDANAVPPSKEQQQSHGDLEEKTGEPREGEENAAESGDVAAAPPVDPAGVQLQLRPPSAAGQSQPGTSAGDSETAGGGDEEEASPCPLPRINPCLTVRGNTLYVYGGLLEVRAGGGLGDQRDRECSERRKMKQQTTVANGKNDWSVDYSSSFEILVVCFQCVDCWPRPQLLVYLIFHRCRLVFRS